MKQQLLIGLATSLLLSGGLLSSSRPSQANILQVGDLSARLPQGFMNLAVSPPADNTAKVGTPPNAARPANAIASIQTYQQSGRDAATLYVRGIPVITFLGANPAPASGVKISTPQVANAPVPPSPSVQAALLAGQLNQLNRDNFDARQIRVVWDATAQTYSIRANQQNLLTLNENTIAPNSSRDRSADALRIANLLRRQLGNAAALTAVEGKTPAQEAAQVVAIGPVRFQLLGHASWYGPGFHGRLTANGERYNQYGMTAAHRTLPFGTRMRVTNLANGRSVVVRVNDRGPYIYGRELDLSKGAAQIIGLMGSGTGRVRMEVLN
jgi:rare lipoprotein A